MITWVTSIHGNPHLLLFSLMVTRWTSWTKCNWAQRTGVSTLSLRNIGGLHRCKTWSWNDQSAGTCQARNRISTARDILPFEQLSSDAWFTWYTYNIAYIAIHHLPHITSHYFTYSTYSCWHVFGELLTQLEAPWKHWMAAPMAVSNCRTAVDFLSLGSTVLAFLIASSPMCRETKHRKFKGHWINKWWNLKWI